MPHQQRVDRCDAGVDAGGELPFAKFGLHVAAQSGPRALTHLAVNAAVGAILAARYVSLRNSVNVLPIGIAMGLVVLTMIVVTQLPIAIVLMIVIGACAGFFVVPMNALLQHRGHVLMGAGHSIAVQNFNENVGILVMVGLYALMMRAGTSANVAIVLFGVFVSGAMSLVFVRHRMNQEQVDSLHLIGIDRDEPPAPPAGGSPRAQPVASGQ